MLAKEKESRDPLIQTIITRAMAIDRSKSYEIDPSNKIIESPGIPAALSTDPWTVRLKNTRKVRPIILKGNPDDFGLVYLGPWWIAGKGRLSLPQEDSFSIWFANRIPASPDNEGVGEQDVSDPKRLTLKRGFDYEITYSDVWGIETVVAQ